MDVWIARNSDGSLPLLNSEGECRDGIWGCWIGWVDPRCVGGLIDLAPKCWQHPPVKLTVTVEVSREKLVDRIRRALARWHNGPREGILEKFIADEILRAEASA